MTVPPRTNPPRRATKRPNGQIVLVGSTRHQRKSISQATGTSRETLRRKLKKLVQHDFIVEKARGRYVVKPRYMQRRETTEVLSAPSGIVRFMNECVELGLIK